jgi:heptosyltransferase-3
MPQIQSFLRKTIFPWLGRSAPAGDEPLPELGSLRTVLLTFVNWRLGNNVLITPAVQALTEAYPDVTFDFLGGPSCVPILKGFRLREILVVKRAQVIDPIRLGWFLRGLRRRGYDAVIHVHPGTATLGAFFAGASRAPVRIGCAREKGNLHFTTTVPRPTSIHKVDRINEVLGHLGLPGGGRRTVLLGEEERAAGEALLLEAGAGPAPMRVALFLSGRARKGKAWSLPFFAELTAGLRALDLQPVVILGPEEVRRAKKIRAALPGTVLLQRLSLRQVASVLASCRLAVTPDSGPMHLAVAAGTPTIGLFRTPTGQDWGPMPGEGCYVYDPSGADVAQVLAAVRDTLAAS